MNKTDKPQLLDVEGEEDRLNRLRSSLQKLDRSSNGNKMPPSLQPDFGNQMPHAINPPTELLSRVQAFLPTLQASNTLLAQRAQADPKSVDIEHIDEGMEQYIEMDLGLGVFEDRSHLSNTRNATSDSDSKSSTSSSEEDSDTDSTSSDEIITAFKPIRPIRPLPRRKLANHPNIVLLGEHS